MSRKRRDDRRPRPRLRTAAMGLALVGAGVLAAALWSAAGAARAAAAGPRGAPQFSAHIDDLPIMPGLAERGDGYAFDLYQGGRLAEARLTGQVDPSIVRGFYAATLTQLGWQASEGEPYIYHRGDERLIFVVESRRGRGLEAVFVVAPTPQATTPAR